MKLLSPVIDVTDFVTLVVVRELQPKCEWKLLTITRLRNAIALVRESPSTRLIFPTEIKPNGVWGGIYKNRINRINPKTLMRYKNAKSEIPDFSR